MNDLDRETLARFWSKVDRRGPDECWEWTGTFTNHGSATFSVGGKKLMVTRLMWGLAGREPLPDSRAILFRSCGNLKCVNPAHLAMPGASRPAKPEPPRGRAKPPRKIDQVRELARRCGFVLIPEREGVFRVQDQQ